MNSRSVAAHLFADWCLQNGWMAENKGDLRHPAAWVHATIHGAIQIPILGVRRSFVVAVSHALIDTRKPVGAIDKVFRPSGTPEMLTHVAIWRDQALHIAVLALLERRLR